MIDAVQLLPQRGIDSVDTVKRATDGNGHCTNGVRISAKVRAKNGTAIGIGLCQLNHGNGGGHRLDGAGARSHQRIDLIHSGFNTASLLNHRKRQFQTRGHRRTKGGYLSFLRRPGNGGQCVAYFSPACALHGT